MGVGDAPPHAETAVLGGRGCVGSKRVDREAEKANLVKLARARQRRANAPPGPRGRRRPPPPTNSYTSKGARHEAREVIDVLAPEEYDEFFADLVTHALELDLPDEDDNPCVGTSPPPPLARPLSAALAPPHARRRRAYPPPPRRARRRAQVV